MHGVQEVKESTRAPRLRGARIVAVGAILVCELRDTSPRILLNVATRGQEKPMQVVQRLILILIAAD